MIEVERRRQKLKVRGVRIFAVIFSIVFFFIGEVTVAIEEPQFKVEKKSGDYEVRIYGPTLVAETTVDGSFEEAGNKAFRVLADFIFGNNKSRTNISMTAPVSQQPQSEKIAMTAPVNQMTDGKGYVIQFTMPAKYNMETIPEPNDSRVHLRELPARKVAVYRYTGSWSESRYLEKLEEFKKLLQKNGVQTQGEPTWARYNSPFSVWFLRRNEIWYEIKNP